LRPPKPRVIGTPRRRSAADEEKPVDVPAPKKLLVVRKKSLVRETSLGTSVNKNQEF
jgi:hypothetical protein